MKTVLTHFYNEEYLLPWWLEHHKKYFDFGILIDYASTDNSVNICKEICPHWQVFPSGNAEFDAELCDYEITFYERQIPGWRIALTVTEFLVGELDKVTHNTEERTQYIIPEIRFVEWNLDKQLDKSLQLWDQLKIGVPHTNGALANRPRSLHNFNDMQYPLGRHFDLKYCNTDEVAIFNYAHAIVGEPMLKRKLQVQEKISDRDIKNNLGWHHTNAGKGLDRITAEHLTKGFFSVGAIDCTEIINKFTQK